MSSDATPDPLFLRDLFRLRLYYGMFRRFMEIFAGGPVLLGGPVENERYLQLCIKIEEILECPKFSTLREVYQRPFDNILSFGDVDIEWECGGSQMCADLQSKIDEMYIRNGRKECELEPAELLVLAEIKRFLENYEKVKQETDKNFMEQSGKYIMSAFTGPAFEDLDKKSIPKTENKSNEFKEFYQYDKSDEYVTNPTQASRKPKTDRTRKHVVEKFAIAVCSFGNDPAGGFVYLGIRSDGTITGLEKDKQAGGFTDYDDSFSNHMRDKLGELLKDKVFITSRLQIKFRNIEGKTICIIQALPSNQPLYLYTANDTAFYVRGPSPRAEKLVGIDQFRYIRRRFPGYE